VPRISASPFPSHSDSVFGVTFSSDGSLLASASGDETLRLWRAADGEMLHILTEHSDVITSVAFSPDGHTLVSGASDSDILFLGLSEAIPLETDLQEQLPADAAKVLGLTRLFTTPQGVIIYIFIPGKIAL